MACDITKGMLELECKNAVSGYKAVYLANYDNYGMTASSTDTGHIISGLGSLSVVYKYELKNSGNTLAQTSASSRDNGTTLYTQTLTFILTKIDKLKEYQVKMMIYGRPLIFVELNTGQIVLLGKNHGCEVSSANGVGGTLDSLNGYTLTAVGTEPEPIYYLEPAAITALNALVSPATI